MKVYDLTHPFSMEMTVFPGTPGMSRVLTSTVERDQYNLGLYTINSHAGTHVDAPRHYMDEGNSLAEIPLEAFIGYTYIADVRSKGQPKDSITVSDLLPYRDMISKYQRVILRTGWESHYELDDFYTDFPVITEECAAWLTDECKIVLLGVEAPSMNPEKHIEVHQQFLKNNVVIVESLTNLGQLTSDVILLSACPLPVAGGDGFPVRAMAIEP